MLEIAYGRTIASHDDSFVAMASSAILRLTEAGSPSASLVDSIPICELRRGSIRAVPCTHCQYPYIIVRYMPTWLPGSGWKRKALDVRKLMHEVMSIPYEKTKEAVVCLWSSSLACSIMNS
ncbi:hypothetical protein C8Q72DRAFT_222129 [Fomitopsis betulina]|nr:hypothetical protein C8Q72DRAFT_222129 [Fomitopsis betulina]